MSDAFGFPAGGPSSGPGGQDQPDPTVAGHGAAAGGLIAVTVSAEARITELRLDPRVLRRGPVSDSAGLADDIKFAVNNALDDLDRQVKEIAGELAAGLDELAAGFEQALEQMATDIARAHRRLED